MPDASLLAWGFVNPLLLGGLGLAALPIIIHFLSRRQFRRIEWGATVFLLAAERENRRRMRFEQWLLLSLRCLAMALLALMISRPFVQSGLIATMLGAGGQTQRILLIDDSASLAYDGGGGESDFERVREAGQRLLDWLSDGASGDVVTILRTSDPTTPVADDVRLSSANVQELKAKIRGLKAVPVPAHPARAVAAIAQKLSTADAQASTDVFVLSDFQRTDWTPADSTQASVFAPLSSLENTRPRVVLVAASNQSRRNVAILDVEADRPHAIAGFPAMLHARIANYAPAAAHGLSLQIEIDGAPLPAVPVDPVEAGQIATTTLEVTFPDEGYSQLVVSLDRKDGLASDDVFRSTVIVKSALRVLIVDGQPAADPMRDEVYFLRNALVPPGPAFSGVRYDVIHTDEIETTPLADYDCVLLCNVPPPRDATADMLSRYVRQGGGLGVFLGSEVGDGLEYNRLFFNREGGFLPAPIEGLNRRTETDDRVGLVRVEPHPLTRGFSESGELSEYVRFRAYYRLREPQPDATATNEADAPTTATVLARFTDNANSPGILERRVGRGRCVLFASTVDLDWNDWPRVADGSYVVTMLELVQYLSGRASDRPSFRGGERLEAEVRPEQYQPTGEFRSPLYPDEPAVEGKPTELTPAIDEPITLEGPVAMHLGAYELELTNRSGSVEARPLCVNLAADESDLAAATSADLNATLGGLPHEYVLANESFLSRGDETRRELWPAAITLLVGVLMLEQLLAWWFGRVRRVRVRPA